MEANLEICGQSMNYVLEKGLPFDVDIDAATDLVEGKRVRRGGSCLLGILKFSVPWGTARDFFS